MSTVCRTRCGWSSIASCTQFRPDLTRMVTLNLWYSSSRHYRNCTAAIHYQLAYLDAESSSSCFFTAFITDAASDRLPGRVGKMLSVMILHGTKRREPFLLSGVRPYILVEAAARIIFTVTVAFGSRVISNYQSICTTSDPAL